MRILIADDHTIVREGIKMLLIEAYPFSEIVDVSNSQDLLRLATSEKWDVIISDISMPPGDSGLEVVKKIKMHSPTTPVLMLSMHSPEQYAVRAMQSGASGYLTKGAATFELVNAVNQVLSGKKYLTPEVVNVLADAFETNNGTKSRQHLSEREFEVFKMLAGGKTISEIAKELSLSANTISTFRSRIFEKMSFHNNLELIKYAIDHKIV
ncbi:response regulator [Sediminibacterium soli]|uniref:response regulator n=1 Tax=Sediminibacterium soli TaxID=2698829 RepID=UPI00137B65BB|nr:response regulator transcription factor [Sediminibacterium soli]NCI46600.1 response regulator transcription factor [Sediminibacterium soli]